MLDWSQTVFGGPWGFLAACGVVFLCDLVYVLLGFGAGMGLSNIARCSDEMKLTSELGVGTRLEARFAMEESAA